MAARSAPRPPFSTDLLADLHADNVAPDLSDQLWPQVRHDPDALRFLRSLDDVTTELRNLGQEPAILHPMPTHVTARLDALLDQLSRGSAESPTPDPGPPDHGATVHRLPVARPAQGPPRTHPLPVLDAEHPAADETATCGLEPGASDPIPLRADRPRRRWLAAAAAAVVIVAGSLITVDSLRSQQSPPSAQPTQQSGDNVQISDDLPVSQLLGAMGRQDLSGPLADHAALVGCVSSAAGLDRSILGAMNATYRGQPAVLILLTGPSSPKITALIVGRDCSPGNPNVLVTQDIG